MKHNFTKTLLVLSLCVSGWLALSQSLAGQDKYAVLVGVGDYDPAKFDRLQFAKDDASVLGKTLDKIGFQTTLITADAPSPRLRPTNPQKILTAVQSVANSCIKGDTLFVSLSGHGVQFLDDTTDENAVPETFFCPEDADLLDKSSLLPISALVEILDRCEASRKLLLIDACRNDAVIGDANAKTARRLNLGSVHENEMKIPGGLSVLFSCSSSQFSWEHNELGHSVFTNFVIEYISGRGDRRYYSNGQLDLDGLVYFVRKNTNQYVFDNHLSADGQLPVLRGTSTNWTLGDLTIEVDAETSLEDLLHNTRLGSVDAQFYLGEKYFYGREVDQDYTMAMQQYTLAAEQGDADGQYMVGLMYHDGLGVEQDGAEAKRWYLQAADQDYEQAKYEIGQLHYYGIDVEQSYSQAKLWYSRAAQSGNASAQYSIGHLFDYGKGVDTDFSQAMEWYLLAAEQNFAVAMTAIGVLYQNGEGVEQNYAEALTWYRRAAELDDFDAHYKIGYLYHYGLGVTQDGREASRWYRTAADTNHVDACVELGELYFYGLGVEQDYEQAMSWYIVAAEQGNAGGQFSVGFLFDYAKGVETDFREAMKWYQLAAEQEHAAAIAAIGVMYRNGDGVAQDYKEAMNWFLRASKQENAFAQYHIGMMVANGEGYQQDRNIAIQWLKKAAENGAEKAKTQLSEWNVR